MKKFKSKQELMDFFESKKIKLYMNMGLYVKESYGHFVIKLDFKDYDRVKPIAKEYGNFTVIYK